MMDWLKTIVGMLGLTAALTLGMVLVLHATGPERTSAAPRNLINAPLIDDDRITEIRSVGLAPTRTSHKPVEEFEKIEQRLTNLEMRLVAVQGLLNQLVGLAAGQRNKGGR